MNDEERKIVNAVLYAMRQGCFFPVITPKNSDGILAWRQWGAMRYLHTAVAEYDRSLTGRAVCRQAEKRKA